MKKILMAMFAVMIIACVGTVSAKAYTTPYDTTKTTTSTSTKTSKKNVKMSSKASKSSTKSKTSTSTKYTYSSTKTTEVNKKIVTTKKVTTKKTKGSKTKKVTTKVTTKTTTTTLYYFSGWLSVRQIAPRANANVLAAFETLGYKVKVDPTVNYNGCCSNADRLITLLRPTDVVYHEIGHFVSFVAGNACNTSEFKSIYSAEKNAVTTANKNYVIQNSSEYFAESYRDYILNPTNLRNTRPRTYTAIVNAVNKITTEQVNKVKTLYAPIWR